ncbi:hypothetical protein QFZ82_003193 [Streptomyces sp. V4I23]|uniref:hypothetical protein n=1 Tax=Streptomyces sp. V4I23 TaxID=3042282 RepID=UPI002786DE46|nr:hypothetical protein [Streptomyces sp. V4I23]MDQ1008708.1 hypothetical protein [Streptomyces sp. V4I23]
MNHPSAREWGRAQAAKSPAWSEERWRRISQILGVDLVEKPEAIEVEGHTTTLEDRDEKD